MTGIYGSLLALELSRDQVLQKSQETKLNVVFHRKREKALGDEQRKKMFFTYKCPLYHIVSKKKGKMPEFGPARGKSLTYPGQKNNITFQKNPYQSLRNLNPISTGQYATLYLPGGGSIRPT